MRLSIFPFALITAIFSTFAFNHSEIKWKSVSSKNFIFHYYDKTEPVLYATAKIAEDVYASLAPLYRYQPYKKINISLVEFDDESNGFANWVEGSIQIMIPDLRFDLRGNTTWVRNVLTHELAHILSIEQKRSFQIIDATFAASYQTPSESFSIAGAKPMVTMYPSWLAEGIAQLETEKAGNDCWDARRDMVLRCAIMEGHPLTLDEMGHFNHNSRGNELVYNQGFSFTRYIDKRIGQDALHSLINRANESAVSFPVFFEGRTGISLSTLYHEWRDEKKRGYKKQVPAHPTRYSTLWASHDYSVKPCVSPDETMIAFLSNDRDDSYRTDCIVKSATGPAILLRIPWAHTVCKFSPSSDLVYYLKSRTENKDGSFLNDLYSCDIKTGKEKRLTHDARIYDFSVMPGGKGLLCVRYTGGGTYSIDRFNLHEGSFDPIKRSPPGESFIHIAAQPNAPSSFAFSQLKNGTSRLFITAIDQAVPTAITLPNGNVESPFWGNNGRLYFNADFDGIFNIYSALPDGSDLQRHSAATGGFFHPTTLGNGKILCSRYGFEGFTIALLDPVTEAYSGETDSTKCSFQTLPQPQQKNDVPPGRPYESVYLRPYYQLQANAGVITDQTLMLPQPTNPDIVGTATMLSFGAIAYQSDALQKKQRALGLAGMLQSIPNNDSAAASSFRRANRFRPVDPSRGSSSTQDIFSTFSDRLESRLSMSPLTNTDPFSPKNAINNATSTTDTARGNQVVPIWEPFFMYQNSATRATINLAIDVPVILIFPASIMTNLSAQWRLTRDLFFQAGLNANLRTIEMFFDGGEPQLQYLLPLTLAWQTNGYYNHNYSYNFANTGALSLMMAPARIGVTTNWVDMNGDTIESALTGAMLYGASGFYSLGLTKFSALQFQTDLSVERYNEFPAADNQDRLSGYSTLYSSGQAGADLVLPLARDINKSFFYYWDALYASLGYRLMLRANKSFFDKPMGPPLSDALKQARLFPRSIWADHAISAGITLGAYSSYFYFGKLQLNASYYVLHKEGSMNVGFGF